MSWLHRLHRRRAAGDRGAAVVEFALAVPVLVVLVLGIMEYGLAFREDNRLERTTSAAARTGGTLANYKYSDFEILKTIDAATANLDNVELIKVIVYKTTSLTGAVPASCLAISPSASSASGVPNLCNVYSRQQVENDNRESGFPGRAIGSPTSCTGGWDTNWCPMSPSPPAAQSRERRRPTPDYLGVYVEAQYSGVTDLVPATLTMTQQAVFAIEPCFKGDVNCD